MVRPRAIVAAMDKANALISSALAVLLDQMGGEMTYTQSEYAAIRARLGEYRIEGEVDRAAPGEPVIRVRLVPSSSQGKMPVA
jgi:hypothetical protein